MSYPSSYPFIVQTDEKFKFSNELLINFSHIFEICRLSTFYCLCCEFVRTHFACALTGLSAFLDI